MTTTTFAYRDDTEGARIRCEDLRDRRTREQRALADAELVRGRRTARIAAGATGLGAAVVLAGAAIGEGMSGGRFASGALTAILLGAWPAMGLAYAAGRVDLWHRLLAPPDRPVTDLHAEIARLSQALPVERARAHADRRERASVALPLIAIALLAPLTIHAAVYALFSQEPIQRFDTWIALSLAIVGHAHLVLAYMGHRFAARLRATETGEILLAWRNHAWSAYAYTVLASAIPGAILILIPPALTGLTGLAFIPLVFRALAHAVVRERGLQGEERYAP